MSLLHPIDGAIVGLYLLGTMVAGVLVRRHVSKVEHFLLAGREMDVALGVASRGHRVGIVTCVYTAQNGFKYGFAGATPGSQRRGDLVVDTGFASSRCVGEYDVAELFERRFGPRVRATAAVVMVLGGLLNMGVFLRTGGGSSSR